MAHPEGLSAASGLSLDLAATVERASASVVRVDDGSRLTATGIVWSGDGTIVTTSHGVERDEEITIELHDGSIVPAALVGRDSDTDIAVLKADAADLVPIEPAGEAAARIGSLLLVVARPGRSGLHATLGMITARTETQTAGRSEYLLHTDADMYPGFSGAPLVDMEGKMLGLANLIFGRGRGMALGIPIVTHVVNAILANGRVQRGYLGVRTQQVALPDAVCALIGSGQTRGLLVAAVEAGSPADAAGLLLGDTILRFGDAAIEEVEALRTQLRANPPGAEAVVEFVRGGEFRQTTVTLGAE